METIIEPAYLYHYTSVENLALILMNKNIRFNNLLDMDDLEEGKTEDFGDLGRFIYASSWTRDSKESIPLWALYTPNMTGVRIKLKTNPFGIERKGKDKEFTKGMIDIENKNEIFFLGNYVDVVKVGYTDDNSKLSPAVYNPSERAKVRVKSTKVGKYKSKAWKFQDEWRYIVRAVPIKPAKLKGETKKEQIKEFIDILQNESTRALKYIDLYLDDNAFKDMEILCGPKVSAGSKIIINDLIDKYNPSAKMLYSELKIR